MSGRYQPVLAADLGPPSHSDTRSKIAEMRAAGFTKERAHSNLSVISILCDVRDGMYVSQAANNLIHMHRMVESVYAEPSPAAEGGES